MVYISTSIYKVSHCVSSVWSPSPPEMVWFILCNNIRLIFAQLRILAISSRCADKKKTHLALFLIPASFVPLIMGSYDVVFLVIINISCSLTHSICVSCFAILSLGVSHVFAKEFILRHSWWRCCCLFVWKKILSESWRKSKGKNIALG